jgi:ankyrin repeat domain-containing protein 50
MGAFLLGLDKVLYLVDRCRIYEILFIHRPKPKDPDEALALENLTSALVELYVLILQFLAKANGLFGKSAIHRSWSAFWNTTDIEDFEKKCQSSEEWVKAEADNCHQYYSHHAQSEDDKKLAQILQDLESQNQLLSDVKSTVDALWSRATDDEQTKILRWTSKIPFEADHYSAQKGRTLNTGEWLLENEKFKEWNLSDASTILWLHGIRKFSLITTSMA